MRLARKVEFPDSSDVTDGDGTLGGFLHTGKYRAERSAVFGQVLFDGTVIDSPENTHVKGNGVGCQSDRMQVCLIVFHDDVVYRPDWNILVVAEPLETTQCGTVLIGSTGMLQLS